MSEPKSGDLLFTYGSLMQGGEYHFLIAPPLAEFLGKACTQSRYNLVDGDYPEMLDKAGTGDRVTGEVYRVGSLITWNDLDWLEEHPHYYERKKASVMLADEILSVWIYFKAATIESN